MSKFVTRFAKDESGATAIEYGLIVALIVQVIVHHPHAAFLTMALIPLLALPLALRLAPVPVEEPVPAGVVVQ